MAVNRAGNEAVDGPGSGDDLGGVPVDADHRAVPGPPNPNREAALLIARTLGPDLRQLLRSEDSDVVVDRVLRLDPTRGGVDDTEHLDRLVADMVVHRRTSVGERLARLIEVVAALSLVVTLGLGVACLAGREFPRAGRTGSHRIGWSAPGWFTWPPGAGVRHAATALVLLAWVAGFAVVVVRAREAVVRARLACRVAAVHRPDSWPGLAIEAPFLRCGRRLSYPGVTMVVGAMVIVIDAALRHHLGVGEVCGALALCVAGGYLLRRAQPWRRAQRLAEQSLFVGRPTD